jgi:hypothetical protein
MRLIIIILIGLSLILCLIGIITNKWYQNSSKESSEGLWLSCQKSSNEIIHCTKQPYLKSQGLSISGLILLSISFILSIIYLNRINDRLLAYFIVLLLLGSTILLLFSYLIYPTNSYLKQFGYSIYFMFISSLMVFITTGLVIFTTRTISSTTTSIYLT